MKTNFLYILFFATIFSCKAQIYPLRTYVEIPENAYLKDTNNELPAYEGTWKGIWNGKTFIINIKKIINNYNVNLKYNKDFLIGKFKVVDSNGLILFDNTSVSDNDVKIHGGKFRKVDDKYSFWYLDSDLCNLSGSIYINFTDSTKTQLNWKSSYTWDIMTEDCQFYNSTVAPEPLPKEIILTKQ
ncbi:hypothetical protein HIO71_06385 [Chryseobacterium aquaticum]|uniref:DUF6705 domain-containing protein n=1 Tax=Chryseobacterium aquaticum TaxID=452084 RepID=A0A848N0G0_9FLAO|nr:MULTISPECIES: DUF6705 family protein [Chryseobacterium]NMR33836.1 hypothetical protein [Chryseobacterium aquaticum]NRQ45912.1 hypothetical protein [Chryseobacterium sp. C-204]